MLKQTCSFAFLIWLDLAYCIGEEAYYPVTESLLKMYNFHKVTADADLSTLPYLCYLAALAWLSDSVQYQVLHTHIELTSP